jgi:hypothetical protein
LRRPPVQSIPLIAAKAEIQRIGGVSDSTDITFPRSVMKCISDKQASVFLLNQLWQTANAPSGGPLTATGIFTTEG